MIKKYLHLALLAFVGFNSPAIAQLPKDSIQLILNTEIAEGQNMIDSLKIISLDEQNLKYKIFRDQDATLSLVPF